MIDRRAFLKLFSALLATSLLRPAFAGDMADFVTGHSAASNFKAVYNNLELRNRFLSFLKNVYSIYPPDKFHALIMDVTRSNDTDAAIYAALQNRLPEVKSLLSPITRQLPSLSHQKTEMAAQVAKLLQGVKAADGYTEIGTTGRYAHGIGNTIKVKGQTYLLHTEYPKLFSLTDIVERGQLMRVGKFVEMGNYKQISAADVPDESLDLITNFIGFHHAPPEGRAAFIASVAKKLRPGGRLLLRDHDVDSMDMQYIVALAHDVFNAGLNVPWEIDLHEVRNFTSVPQIEEALGQAGLHRMGDKFLQSGDPTKNTMMLFVKA